MLFFLVTKPRKTQAERHDTWQAFGLRLKELNFFKYRNNIVCINLDYSHFSNFPLLKSVVHVFKQLTSSIFGREQFHVVTYSLFLEEASV